MKTQVRTAVAEGIATLTLVPGVAGKPPTLDLEVLGRLESALEEAKRAGPRLLLLRSAEAKYFCVGADLGALRYLNASNMAEWIDFGHRVFAQLEDFPAPTVACVEGYALGGGLELALACDLIFAASTARFGQTEAKLGFVAGWGGTWRLPRRVGRSRAKELSFRGRVLPADEARSIGLADFCGSAAEMEAELQRLAGDIREGSALSIREFKRLINAAPDIGRPEANRAEVASSLDCVADPETQARVTRFLNRSK